jgi:transposase
MEVVHERCAGLDIHKQRIVACRIGPGADGTPAKALRTFGTMTADLEALAAWLEETGVTHVAMESTGVYWKPIYNRLESRFTLLLVNAHHLKAVPGRKTDVKDSEWIADLLRHGLLRGSFVPAREQRELRELTRYRTTLIQERTAALNRLQKTLEGANIKLTSVASDVLGKSGRAIVEAMIAGQTEAAALAELAAGRLREKLPQLERALAGSLGAHQRFLLGQQLAHIDFLESQIAQVSAEVEARLRPFETAIARLDTLPGVGRRTAETLVAEIGTDLSRFPSAGHLASWAALCPGNRESAGKRLSGKTRKGNAYLRAVLIEAAHAAARTKNTYIAAKYHRLAQRLGKKKAAVAIAHLLLRVFYVLLTQQTLYHELGADYLEQRDREALQRRLVRRLEKTGVTVTLTPHEPAA